MATRLDTFPGDDARPPRRYPWNEWTDGSTWQIRRGEDYDPSHPSCPDVLEALSLVEHVCPVIGDDGPYERAR